MKNMEMITLSIVSRDFALAKMADDPGGAESQLLGRYVEKQTKYGTTTRLVSKSSSFVKHKVCSSDTLMGIALRYGTTVEQVKRENKLWTNDSLFLREHLLIPVAVENIADLPENCEIVEIDNALRSRTNSNRSRSNSQLSNNSDSDSHKPKDSENKTSSPQVESGKDFLSKFDNSFAVLKSNVQKMEKNTSFHDDVNNPLTHLPRKSSQSSRSSSWSAASGGYQNSGYNSNEASPVLMIKSRTHKMQSSINKLEETNDELFQL